MPGGAGINFERLKEQLLISGPESIFQGECLGSLKNIIASYDPKSEDYILQAAAAAMLMNKYVYPAKDKSPEISDDTRLKAIKICQRFYYENRENKSDVEGVFSCAEQAALFYSNSVNRVLDQHPDLAKFAVSENPQLSDLLTKEAFFGAATLESKLVVAKLAIYRLEYFVNHFSQPEFRVDNFLNSCCLILREFSKIGMEYGDNADAQEHISRAFRLLNWYNKEARFFSFTYLNKLLLENGLNHVFNGDCSDIIKEFIKYYSPEKDYFVLYAAAAALFLKEYLVAAKNSALEDDIFPEDLRQKAAQICRRYSQEHQQDGQPGVLSAIRDVGDWFDYETASFCVYPQAWLMGASLSQIMQRVFEYNSEGLQEIALFESLVLKKIFELNQDALTNEAMYSVAREICGLTAEEQINDRASKSLIWYTANARLIHLKFCQGGENQEALYKSMKDLVFSSAYNKASIPQNSFLAQVRYLLTDATIQTLLKSFLVLSLDELIVLARAAKCIVQYDNPVCFRKWQGLINKNNELDVLPYNFSQKLKEYAYSFSAYLDNYFDDNLTLDRFGTSSIQGKACIVRAVQFRLMQMRVGGKQYDTDICREYCAILQNCDYTMAPNVVETILFFDSSQAKYYILDDCGNIKSNVVEYTLVLDARHKAIKEALDDPNFTNQDERRRLVKIYRDYEKNKFISNDDNYTLDGNIDDLKSRIFSKGKLNLNADTLTKALTYDTFINSSVSSKQLLAQAALMRLQKIAYVDSDAFLQEQRKHYLEIVMAAQGSVLKNDVSFCSSAQELLLSFQVQNNVVYADAQFDDTYSKLIELAFYQSCSVSDLGNISQVLNGLKFISPRTISIILQHLETYIKDHEEKLRTLKRLPIADHSIAEAQHYVLALQRFLQQTNGDGVYASRVIEALKVLDQNGHYDDKYIMYESAVEARFNHDSAIFTARNNPFGSKWVFDGASTISGFLNVDNYDAGSFKTRLLFVKAVCCLLEKKPECYNEALIDLALRAYKDDMWWDDFPIDVRVCLDRIVLNKEVMGEKVSRKPSFWQRSATQRAPVGGVSGLALFMNSLVHRPNGGEASVFYYDDRLKVTK